MISKIKKLTSDRFENLVYDLMVCSGMRDVVWRTPGADGGRDVEGVNVFFDLSGATNIEKWYVECKKYNSSIGWPTVDGKLAYAKNHDADYLLMVTTDVFTPRCKDEIAKYNENRKTPRIRFWEKGDIERRVQQYPVLLRKYGLKDVTIHFGSPIEDIVDILLKSVLSSYNSEVFKGEPSASMELAASIAEILKRLVTPIAEGESSITTFNYEVDLYPWCDIAADVELGEFDALGMRFLLASFKLVSKNEKIAIRKQKDGALYVDGYLYKESRLMKDVSKFLRLFTNIEIFLHREQTIIRVK